MLHILSILGLLLLMSAIITAIGLMQLSAVADASREMMAVPVAKERLISDWSKNISTAIVRTIAVAKSSDETLATFFKAAF